MTFPAQTLSSRTLTVTLPPFWKQNADAAAFATDNFFEKRFRRRRICRSGLDLQPDRHRRERINIVRGAACLLAGAGFVEIRMPAPL